MSHVPTPAELRSLAEIIAEILARLIVEESRERSP